MNLRAVVSVLGLLAVISTAAGGYLYYNSVRESALKETEKELFAANEALRDDVARIISLNQGEVKALAGFEQLQEALVDRQNKETLLQANRVLDHFAEGLAYDVCFLIDKSGNAIASSNRNRPDTFVGVNYLFRKYFQDAVQGKSGIELALGFITGTRGIFVSHPVYLPGSASPIGVVVIKVSTRDMDRVFSRTRNMIALLVNSDGMIFISSRENWILNLLWRLSPDELERIRETRQFGKGPWNWTGLEEKADNQVLDSSSADFDIREMSIENCRGWRIVSLYNYKTLSGKIFNPLLGETGYIAFILCLMVGGAVIVLYLMAQSDITERQRVEDALRKSEEKYRLLSENTPDVIWQMDLDLRFTYVNPAIVQVTGYTQDEWIGTKLAEHCDEENFRKMAQVASEEISKGTDSSRAFFEAVMLNKNRQPFPVEISGKIIFGENGLPIALQGVTRDITERKRVEEALRDSEERYRTLFETAADGIFIFDAEGDNRGKIISANPAAVARSGYTIDELLALRMSDLDTTESAKQFPRRLEQLLTGEILRDEVTHRRKDGSVLSLEICDRLFVQGGHQYIVAMHRDITERKRLEEDKRNLIIDLQNALSEVKKLSGFLPICASCKKIRDDKGYWNQVEKYISDHSEAQFSHGICPDCMRKLYPEYC